MGKTAWIFPGQGSQYVGMGRELCERYEEAEKTFQQAEKALGAELCNIMFEGPAEVLKQTENAQPAIFLHSVAVSRTLASMGFAPDMVAGHSLGEYSALVAAGALDFEEGLRLVKDRAISMQEACDINPGVMCAILGLDAGVVEGICSKISDGVVDVANMNSPAQVVISGAADAVEIAAETAKQSGAKKTVPLPVSGAFHSRLMRPAAEKFEPSVLSASISRPSKEFFPNVSAFITDRPDEIRNGLIDQICSPVRWQSTIEIMIQRGADNFVEVGPGTVLTGLLKRIDKSVAKFNADKPETIEEAGRTL